MSDGPMDAGTTQHPEEGLIHAWLDEALSAAEAERLAAHVRTCVACQARVAEARGLIAGASRVVAELDDVPAATRPAWAQSALADGGGADGAPSAAGSAGPAAQRSLWRWLRVTPGRAALAATIVVAVGITLTYDRAAMDSTPRSTMATFDPQKADAPATTSPEGEASNAAKPRDALLDSAVARNLAMAQGRRTVGAAPGPNVPNAPPPSATPQLPVGAAGEEVALGRAQVQAQRESAGIAADRSRTKIGGAAAATQAPTTLGLPARPAAAGALEQTARRDAMMAKKSADAVAKSCVLLNSPDSDARWADQAFPMVVALDSGLADRPRQASVLTPAGEPTSLRATWSPRGDSIVVQLRRIGYSGSIVLGPDAGARSGIAVSAAAPTMLEEVAVGEPSAPARAEAPRADSRKAAAAAPRPTPPAGPPIRQLRVTARSVVCPAH